MGPALRSIRHAAKKQARKADDRAAAATTHGRSGDLVPISTSFDETGRYGLQTPFAEGVSHLWKGSMWHVDGLRNSLITAGNGGTGTTHAAVTLFYNNGKSSYAIEKQLEPGKQIWANVGDIIREQIPDKNGKTIPPISPAQPGLRRRIGRKLLLDGELRDEQGKLQFILAC